MVRFEDDDFLDLADEHGHVVEHEGTVRGFVDFGLDDFLNFCQILVERAQADEGPHFTIANPIDYALALAMLVALEAQLNRIYEGDPWGPKNRYVMSYYALKEGLAFYEKSVMVEVEQVQ